MAISYDPQLPLYIGLMSGTSADGIDTALVQFPRDGGCRFVHGVTAPWPADLRARLIDLGQGGELHSVDELALLDARVGLAFADAAITLLRETKLPATAVRAIGSHGQTVRHRPTAPLPYTVQIGDAHRIAEATGITTVADFRRRDVAAGGHGAPLMPAFHLAMLGHQQSDCAILNLGGIANLSLIPRNGQIRGFDTGPANALLDAWCELHTGNPYDADGAFAASGTVHPDLLTALKADPWFALPPPKSTGREHFHLEWLDARLSGQAISAADVQATLLELTVQTVTDALLAQLPQVAQLLVCGGGVRNGALMARLQHALPKTEVSSSARYGLDPDYMEALGFAWLAREALDGRPSNLPSVSGAAGPRILGAIHPA